MPIHLLDTRIGSRIKLLRLERGVSDAAAASTLDLSDLNYRQRELGVMRFSAAEIWRLAHLFDVSLSDIYQGFSRGASLEPPARM
jgi:transcriptional regulator with XRE-family HTH domain